MASRAVKAVFIETKGTIQYTMLQLPMIFPTFAKRFCSLLVNAIMMNEGPTHNLLH